MAIGQPTLDAYTKLAPQVIEMADNGTDAIGVPYFRKVEGGFAVCPLCGDTVANRDGGGPGRHWTKHHAPFVPTLGFMRRTLDEKEVPEAVALQWFLREQARVKKADVCIGCYLGDAGVPAHDYGYGCEYGAGFSL